MTLVAHELGEVEQIITYDGAVYTLGDGFDQAVLSVGGRGMPGASYQTVQGYRQPFPTVRGYQIEPRAVALTLFTVAERRADYWAARRALVEALRFNRGGPLTLRHIRADGTARDLLCYPDGSPDWDDESAWDAWETEIALVAHAPLFQDAAPTSLRLDQAGGALMFPMAFPIAFEGFYSAISIDVSYTGDFPAWPLIEVDGPYTTLRLVNESTGAVVGLAGATALGEKRFLDLTPGRQSLVDGDGVSRWGELWMPDSVLMAFNLRPAGAPGLTPIFEGVPGGVNRVKAVVTGRTEATAVQIHYRQQYFSL